MKTGNIIYIACGISATYAGHKIWLSEPLTLEILGWALLFWFLVGLMYMARKSGEEK